MKALKEHQLKELLEKAYASGREYGYQLGTGGLERCWELGVEDLEHMEDQVEALMRTV